ncbi:hypothetical protein EU803_10465 [Loktanella sp. IMCC34160]|uniref:hypothetical protein n=1 Tax=Loktanella sp. IMCC34160 TaxID=2510646 RepID=UPI00101C69E9|nr:hypothetical protein [Loktanella sp. IMCC34160]RYG91505.1 hypothetical protein EU803_10465 [Loktanella sp. IMCC34160]
MKTKIAIAAVALSLSGVAAQAGNLSPVVIETPPTVLVQDDDRGSFGLLLPLALIGGVIALASASAASGS